MATDDMVPGGPIAEAAKMMRGLVFSTASGGSMRGEHVQIIADPRWDEDVQAYRLLLQCYAPGYDSRQWAGMPVVLRNEEGSAPSYVARLDVRGRAVVPALPQGEYGLRTATTWLVGEAPVAQPVPGFWAGFPSALSSPGLGGRFGTFPEPSAQDERFAAPTTTTLVSNDARLQCAVRQASGWIYLGFETAAETLATGKIYFTLADAGGRIRHDGELALAPAGDERRWRAYWEGPVELTEPVTLVCLAWSPEE